MALAIANRVLETSTTTGTGTYSLAGAVSGYQTFVAGIGTGNTCYYAATLGANWEVGVGTVTDATPDTLARTTIIASSNGGAAVDWAAGTKSVFVTIPASKAVYADASGNVGIGTASPNNRLQVLDYINFDDTNFNTLLGRMALHNAVGVYNVAIGYSAGYFNDTTGVGYEGDSNVYIGYAAGVGSEAVKNTGYWNVFVGHETGAFNQTGHSNTFIGLKSGYLNTGGYQNCGLGLDSLNQNLTGCNLIGIGWHAGYYNTASNNIFIGSTAGRYITTGTGNVIIGNAATAGVDANCSYSIVIGPTAGTKLTSASCVMIGNTVGQNTVNGANNIFIGANVGDANVSGANNVYIGHDTGYLSTGSGNVYLGYFAGWKQTTESNTFIVDNQVRSDKATGQANALLYGTFAATAASQILSIHAKVGINIAAPAEQLQSADAIAISNTTEGNTARMTRRTVQQVVTLTGSTSVTTFNIPAGALLLGASFCVNTAVSDDTADPDTWSAAFSGGSTATLATAAAAAKQTKVDTMIVPAVASATTNITFTPQGGSFDGGVIEVVAYYEVLTSLADAA